MNASITIRQESCIRCQKCTNVCPAGVFSADEQHVVTATSPGSCIVCGHCVAVCPTASVVHAEFPPEKVHPIDRTLLPSPEQLLLLIQSRRSNRAISPKPIPEASLNRIVEAAHRAPTASNLQQLSFTLVTDPEKLRQVSALTLDTFTALARKIGNPVVKPFVRRWMPEVYRQIPRFGAMKEAFEAGKDPILRGATALLLIHAPKKNAFGSPDANLAYQNGSLMAESLNVTQFYTGFVCRAIQMDKKRRVATLLGIEGTIHAGMALAMPAFLFPNYIDKKELSLTRFS